jgi:hypothetical protein
MTLATLDKSPGVSSEPGAGTVTALEKATVLGIKAPVFVDPLPPFHSDGQAEKDALFGEIPR